MTLSELDGLWGGGVPLHTQSSAARNTFRQGGYLFPGFRGSVATTDWIGPLEGPSGYVEIKNPSGWISYSPAPPSSAHAQGIPLELPIRWLRDGTERIAPGV